MFAAYKVGATGKAANDRILVKADILYANAGQQFGLHGLPQPWRINSIEVKKNRPVGLETEIEIAAGPPCNLALYPEVFFQQQIAAEYRVHASPDSLRR